MLLERLLMPIRTNSLYCEISNSRNSNNLHEFNCSKSSYLVDPYRPHSGACRNENGRYDDKGSGSGNSLLACKQSCDATQGCRAVSWNGNNHCYMTSQKWHQLHLKVNGNAIRKVTNNNIHK